MKTITRYLPLLLLLAATLGGMAHSGNEATPAVKVEDEQHFTFKTDRKFIGASVEIYYNGVKLTSQRLEKRKVVIDFGRARIGEYTIRIRKGDEMQEYRYTKK